MVTKYHCVFIGLCGRLLPHCILEMDLKEKKYKDCSSQSIMLWFNYLMQPFVFSVTQLEINFSHQQWSCVKVYLNKLVKLKITFSHSNLENNFWFENAKQQLCFFLLLLLLFKHQVSKICSFSKYAFLMSKFDRIWKKPLLNRNWIINVI